MSSCPGHVPALVGETGIQNSVSCTGWGQVGGGTQRRWPGGELPENEVPKLLGKDGQELTKHKAGRKTGRADGMARSKAQRAIWEGEAIPWGYHRGAGRGIRDWLGRKPEGGGSPMPHRELTEGDTWDPHTGQGLKEPQILGELPHPFWWPVVRAGSGHGLEKHKSGPLTAQSLELAGRRELRGASPWPGKD